MDFKFENSIHVNDYQVKTDNGWEDVHMVHKTIPYQLYEIKTETGKSVKCADTHIFFDDMYNEIYAKNLSLSTKIITIDGIEAVTSIVKHDEYKNMYDLELGLDTNQRYYTNGILSHNTTTYSIYILHYLMFNIDKKVLILGNKLATAIEIMDRVKMAYEMLPMWIKPGIVTYNKTHIEFSNGCKIVACATSSDAARSQAVNVVVMDELAFVPKNVQDALWSSVYPIISSAPGTKVIVVSTPNGVGDLFHTLYSLGEKDNDEGWKAFKFLWSDVPGRDDVWMRKQKASLGSEQKWKQEFGCSNIANTYVTISYDGKIETITGTELLNKMDISNGI